MRARTLTGYALVVAFAAGVLGCGGGGTNNTPPAAQVQSSSTQTGKVTLSLTPARSTASAVRNPKYVPPGITGISYVVRHGASTVASGTATFSSCTASGPCTTTISLPVGTGYIATVTETAGTTQVGSGVSSSFDIVAGPNADVTVVMDAYGGNVTVLSTSGPVTTWVADGTTQYQLVAVNILDPLGNSITTQYGALPNYQTNFEFTDSDCGAVSDPSPPPAPAPSTTPTGQFVYNGQYPCSSNATIQLNAYYPPVNGTPLPVPVVRVHASADAHVLVDQSNTVHNAHRDEHDEHVVLEQHDVHGAGGHRRADGRPVGQQRPSNLHAERDRSGIDLLVPSYAGRSYVARVYDDHRVRERFRRDLPAAANGDLQVTPQSKRGKH